MKRDEAIRLAAQACSREHLPGELDSRMTHNSAGGHLGIQIIDALETLGVLKFDEPLDNYGKAAIDQSLIGLITTDLASDNPMVALAADLRKAGLALVRVAPCAS